MEKIKIHIGKDFSKFPIGRYAKDGEFSAEAFRNKWLVPALRSDAEVIEIDLSGSMGYGSSFLEEAFGGLVREDGFSEADLRTRLYFVLGEYDGRIPRIWEFIHNAAEVKRASEPKMNPTIYDCVRREILAFRAASLGADSVAITSFLLSMLDILEADGLARSKLCDELGAVKQEVAALATQAKEVRK